MYPKLNDKEHGAEFRKTTTLRLISMLSVNFVDKDERNLAMAEFGTFLREYNLTSEEVLEAYRMGLKKELQNIKGDTINIYPNLSLIQAGEVLNAYKEFKITNHQHTQGMKLLREATKKPEIVRTPEEIREEFLQDLYRELTEKKFKFSSDGWLLFDELELAGKIPVSIPVKKRLYKIQLARHKKQTEAEAKHRGNVYHTMQILEALKEDISKGVKIGSVVNRCRSITVCNYLKKHLTDFETFKSAINGQVD